jgi:SAM-dependent methyltransferase
MSARIEPFDRDLLASRRRRAARAWRGQGGADFLLARAVDDLLDRLAAVRRSFETVVVLGAQDGRLGAALRGSGRHRTVLELERVRGPSVPADALVVLADEEALPLRPHSVDLVLSPLVLQHVNDLPGTLLQVRQALRPDGLLLASLVGGESLGELRIAFAAAESEAGRMHPRVAPFADGRDLGGLLQRAGFALPVVDTDRVEVAYRHPLDLMHDLRAMGATNVLRERSRAPLRRAVLRAVCREYAERFARSDGKALATFELLTITGWAPDASQQKPLAPGSARMRLAEALGTTEVPAGERPPAAPPRRT